MGSKVVLRNLLHILQSRLDSHLKGRLSRCPFQCVCETRLGEVRIEGVGVFGAVPLSLEWVCFDKTSGETRGS